MAAYDYSTTMTTTITPATATTSSLPIPADARSMIAGGVPEYAPPIPTKEQKESKEQIDFSHGLLEDESTYPENISSGMKTEEILAKTIISETFRQEKKYHSIDRFKKRELLSIAIELYKKLEEQKTNTDYDEVLKELPYKDEDKSVIKNYLTYFESGGQPEDWRKIYQALGPEKDKDKLFWRMPCLEDILQGNIGDCYLLAALQAIVNKDPTIILRMMRDNGNGTVTVRLFDEQGNPHYYIIEKKLRCGFSRNCMWVQMVERAFLIHRKLFPSTNVKRQGRLFENKKEDIDGGITEDALSSILGTPKSELEMISFQSMVEIVLDKNNGLATIGAHPKSTKWPCETDHSYAILGYINNPSTGFYTLVTEPFRGGGGNFDYATGVNYDPCGSISQNPEKCEGREMMWLLLNNLLTPEELAYIISVFDADDSPFKYLKEKGRWYYEQQRKNKAVK